MAEHTIRIGPDNVPVRSLRFDWVKIDVVGQADLAAHWYAEARNALWVGDLELSLDRQSRAAFRHRCAMSARFENIDKRRAELVRLEALHG